MDTSSVRRRRRHRPLASEAKSDEAQPNTVTPNMKITSGYGWNYCGPAWLGRALEVDVRSIALFRIVVAAVVLWDVLYEYLPEAWWWLTDEGHYTREVYMKWDETPWSWSLYMLNKSQAYPYVLLIFHAIVAVVFATGILPRLSAFVLWVLHMSLRERSITIVHGGDALLVTCITTALFLPCDFYYWRPGLPQTTRRMDMSVFMMWCALLATWVGNAFDKQGTQWNEDFTSVYLSLGMTNLATKAAIWIRASPIGWQVCQFLTRSTFWVEFLCPIACLFPGGEMPWVRVLGAAGLAGMHISFLVLYRLGDFAPLGVACSLLILPPWFWDHFLPNLLRLGRVYEPSARFKQHFLWLYQRINPKCTLRFVRVDAPNTPSTGVMQRPTGPTPRFDLLLIGAVWAVVTFSCYPCTYTLLIGIGSAVITAGVITTAKAMWTHWGQVALTFWAMVAVVRAVFLFLLGLSVLQHNFDRWTDEDGVKYVDLHPYGFTHLRSFMGLLPPRCLFAATHLGGGPGQNGHGGWHIAAGIVGQDEEQILDFWPFTSSTSPFAPFYIGDGLSVPRPVSMEPPYLIADEYPHSRWENFISRGSHPELARYICQRFKHLNLTVLSIYKVELRETTWREAPYHGWTPLFIYRTFKEVCPQAELWDRYKDGCKNCPWPAIHEKVMSAFKIAYPLEKILAQREFDLRDKLLGALEKKQIVRVRMRELYKYCRVGDVGEVVNINDELWDPPVLVQFDNNPHQNGSFQLDYHNFEILSITPPRYTSLPNMYCSNRTQHSTKYGAEHDVITADACVRLCSDDASCSSAEFFASDPVECFLSPICDDVVEAKKNWEVTLFLKGGVRTTPAARLFLENS